MLISIIVPCYNVENYIDRCVQSIVNQSIGLDEIEVILVNDASTDNTLQKIKKWQSNYPQNIEVITYDENKRQGGARNIGIKAAKGELLGFVDADDWIEPDMYEVLYKELTKSGADVAVCRNDCVKEYEIPCRKESDYASVTISFEKKEQYYKKDIPKELKEKFNGGVWAGLYKKNVILDNEVFFPEHLVYEDNYWGEILSLYISKQCFVDKILYHYFINCNSTVNSVDSNWQMDRFEIERLLYDRLEKLGALQLFYDKFCKDAVQRLYLNTYYIFFTRFHKIPCMFKQIDDLLKKYFPDYRDRISSELKCEQYLIEILDYYEEIDDSNIEVIRQKFLQCCKVDKTNNVIKNTLKPIFKNVADNGGSIEDYRRIESILEEIKKDKYDFLLFENYILDFIKTNTISDDFFIYLVSLLMKSTGKGPYVELFIDSFRELPLKGELFYYYQLNAFLFGKPEVEFDKAYLRETYDEILREIRETYSYEKKDKKICKDRVVIMTNQLINEEHAPTHSTLERAAALKKNGKEVTIIATDEFNLGMCLMMCKCQTFAESMSGGKCVHFQGEEIPILISRKKTMSEKLMEIFNILEEISPELVVYVGGESFVADIVNDYYPVCKVSTVFSSIPYGHTSYLLVGREISKEEQNYLPDTQIISIPFKFQLKKKKRDYSRNEFEIPQEAFVVAVVGSRLDSDVSEEFLSYLNELDIFTLFIGRFDSYLSKINQFENVKSNSTALGQINDVNGVIQIADLYVNPKRMGGGFSVIEAMNAGIPAVSINYGDVATAAGEDFCVENYDMMAEEIKKYIMDRAYYSEMKSRAIARAAYMTSAQKEFVDALNEIILQNE